MQRMVRIVAANASTGVKIQRKRAKSQGRAGREEHPMRYAPLSRISVVKGRLKQPYDASAGGHIQPLTIDFIILS